MTIETLSELLGWSAAINYGLLILWFLLFTSAHDWLHRMHSGWFSLSREAFDAIQYGLMGAYELGIFLFFLVPYFVLQVIS